MANAYMKRCTASLVVRKMQNKSTVSHYYTSIRRAKIRDGQYQVLAKRWPSGTVRHCPWELVVTSENWDYLLKLLRTVPRNAAPRKLPDTKSCICASKDKSKHAYAPAIIAPKWKPLQCTSVGKWINKFFR